MEQFYSTMLSLRSNRANNANRITRKIDLNDRQFELRPKTTNNSRSSVSQSLISHHRHQILISSMIAYELRSDHW